MWLRQIPPDYLQQAGWIHANQQFHGIVMAARTYANLHYAEPGQAAAFFEGIVLALTVLERQAEVDRLQQLLDN